jgi:tetratricopeptide (TPR) repeat protein
LPVYWIPGLVVSLLVVVPIGYVYNVKLIYHNRLFLDTIARPGQTLQGTLNNFRDVLEISDFDKREVAIKLGQFIGQHALSTSMSVDELQRSYRFVMNTMEEAIREKPKDVRLILSYGNTMNVYGETIREHDKDESERVLRKAENALKEAIELGPRRQQVFHSLANTYLIQGHGDKAVQVLKDAISVHEDSPTSHWILAVVYIRIDEKQLALASAESALNKGYKITTEQEMVPILELYIELKEYEKLIRIYRNVAGEQSTDSDYARIKAKEAAIHAQLGNKEEAIKAANEVRRTDPSLYGEVNDFINTVEAGGEADFVHLR